MRTFDNGVWTSEEAKEDANKEHNETLVWQALVKAGHEGLTDDELQVLLGMPGNSQRPARRQLVKDGAVWDTGQWRRTRTGRKAIVWAMVARISP